MTARQGGAILLLFAGCGGATLEQLKGPAASALSCHESRIAYQKIGKETYFVSGCGKEASFVEQCENNLYKENCRWTLQSTVYPAGTAQKERDLAEERAHGTAPDPTAPMRP